MKKNIDLLKIQAGFTVPEGDQPGFALFLQSIESLLAKIITPKTLEENELKTDAEFYNWFSKQVPIVHFSLAPTAPSAVAISFICPAEYTHGVGRYLCDMSSRWLVPGKQLPLTLVRSLGFSYVNRPEHNYFLTEIYARASTPSDLNVIRNNQDHFTRETRLNILAVQHARHVVTLKPLTLSEKKIIIQENFASLIEKPSSQFDDNIFDQMHHLLIKASAEENVSKIKDELSPLIQHRPKIFDRDTFNELQRFIILFKDAFTAIRDTKHLTRIISYQYLFKKSLLNDISAEPNKRHLTVKFLKTKIQEMKKHRPVLGLLITLNRLREHEIFEQRHILKSIQSYLPDFRLVENSYVVDHKEDSPIRTIYLEVTHKDGRAIVAKEIQVLRQHLQKELISRIETAIHPIFMYRNEEETMRNILVLSNQLKYVHDIPQVIVSFHQQTPGEVSFTVILLQLSKPDTVPIKNIFSESSTILKLNDLDVKIVGLLRKKYPKEANVFELSLDKSPFLRKDFSLDLYKARQAVIIELSELIGEFRDYNGGMISKQTEVFKELRTLVHSENIRNDFLLENFFYSLSPTYMQSLVPPSAIKEAFMLLHHQIEKEPGSNLYETACRVENNFCIYLIASSTAAVKDQVGNALENFTSSYQEIASSYVRIYDVSYLIFILRFHDQEEHKKLTSTLENALLIWDESEAASTTRAADS